MLILKVTRKNVYKPPSIAQVEFAMYIKHIILQSQAIGMNW